MSNALYRLGRSAAEHPWRVIAAWLTIAAVVVASSLSFGRTLEDSFEVPGLDSQTAFDLGLRYAVAEDSAEAHIDMQRHARSWRHGKKLNSHDKARRVAKTYVNRVFADSPVAIQYNFLI